MTGISMTGISMTGISMTGISMTASWLPITGPLSVWNRRPARVLAEEREAFRGDPALDREYSE